MFFTHSQLIMTLAKVDKIGYDQALILNPNPFI